MDTSRLESKLPTLAAACRVAAKYVGSWRRIVFAGSVILAIAGAYLCRGWIAGTLYSAWNLRSDVPEVWVNGLVLNDTPEAQSDFERRERVLLRYSCFGDPVSIQFVQANNAVSLWWIRRHRSEEAASFAQQYANMTYVGD
jgi:hypothetical protein